MTTEDIEKNICEIYDNKNTLMILKELLNNPKFQGCTSFLAAAAILFTIQTNTKVKDKNEDDINIDQSIEYIDNNVQSMLSINEQLQNILTSFNVIMPKEMTIDDKLDTILEREKLTFNQFLEITKTVLAESGGGYEETYHVMSVVFNRTISNAFVNESDKYFDNGLGYNLYVQIIMPNQFSAYKGGRYFYFDNMSIEELKKVPGYKAIIDCLYSYEPSNNYLAFNDSNGEEHFTDKGNYYRRQLSGDDIISIEDRTPLAYGNEAKRIYSK